MSNSGHPTSLSPSIDLAAVCETLLYIESDLRDVPQHARLRAILRLAITEIGLLEDGESPIAAPPAAALFLPAEL